MIDTALIEKKLAFIETCVRELEEQARPELLTTDVREAQLRDITKRKLEMDSRARQARSLVSAAVRPLCQSISIPTACSSSALGSRAEFAGRRAGVG